MHKTKRSDKPRKPKSSSNLQYGIFGLGDMDSLGAGSLPPDDEEDEDLEAELEALMAGPTTRSPRPKPVAKVLPAKNLDAMVAESLRDVPSDEDVSGDEDDPDLLAELSEVTGEAAVAVHVPVSSPVSTTRPTDMLELLNERIGMYKEAEAHAKSIGDTLRARRLDRGLKTLSDLLKKAQSGAFVNENDIPLPVSTKVKKPQSPTADDDSPGTKIFASSENDGAVRVVEKEDKDEEAAEKQRTLARLAARRDEYKKAALLAKKAGDTELALQHVKIIKQFEVVMSGVEAGQPVDLSSMPPAPSLSEVPKPAQPEPPKVESEKQHSETPVDAPQQGAEEPLTIESALEQRLRIFQEQEASAKKDGNASKARRMGRIVKQYQDAIKLHKAGKPIPVDELPTPPGCAPIPVAGSEGSANTVAPTIQPEPSPAVTPEERPPPSPVPPPRQAAPPPPPRQAPPPPPSKPSTKDQEPAKKGAVTRQSKQMAALVGRQKQFKEAALAAKKRGDLVQAKEYLRLARGFDPLIEASSSGLPVDMATLPVPPGAKEDLEANFEVVVVADCIPGTDSEIYDKLLSDLQLQMKMCMETRNHFKSMGDVASANKFERLAVNTKKDYDTVRASRSNSDSVPRFRYEKKTFSIVRCNVDLGDNDLELVIVQGVNYNVPNPKEIDTYVKYEFPYPNDEIKKEKTAVVYNTNNPSYETTFLIPIQRNVRAFQRLFKRHAIKCEIWSRGGFLRSDTLVGTVHVKLQPLETKCTLHDSFDLMEGRRNVGGKLEVKVRVRHPILTKQVEQVEEKWLVIL